MKTGLHCPIDGRMLREVRTGAGGVEPGWLVCGKGHGWSVTYEADRTTLSTTDVLR